MRTFAALGLFALLAVPALADAVLFKDDLELSGPQVEVLREYDQGVDVKVPHGTITLLWSRIKSITIDYEAHLANMKADGRESATDLNQFVRVLVRHDMMKQAVEVCRLILAQEKVPESVLVEVGELLARQQEWGAAKAAYEMVLRTNPSRQDILARLDEANKNVKEPAKGPAAEPGNTAGAEPAKQPGAEPAKQPEKEPAKQPTAPQVEEGLESEEDWVSEPWGSRADVTVVQQGQEVKNRVLSVAYADTDKDKVAVRLGGTWDLTTRGALVFDVWNAGVKSLGLSVAFNTMPDWKFYESSGKSIPPKEWTTVKFSLGSKRFKCEESKWRNTSELKNRDNVKQVILLIYNTSKTGVIYFDNIRFVDQGAPED